jgi:hypothetical protein
MLNCERGGEHCVIKLNIIDPHISAVSGNGVYSKKLSVTASQDTGIDLTLEAPLNLVQGLVRNRRVMDGVWMEIGSDGKYHIRGYSWHEGTASIPFSINGKRFVVKINVRE